MDLNYHSQFSVIEDHTVNERRVLDPIHSFINFDPSMSFYYL